jgi:hypothetical protein
MRIIIFSGKGGSGVSTLAAATAVAAAQATSAHWRSGWGRDWGTPSERG